MGRKKGNGPKKKDKEYYMSTGERLRLLEWEQMERNAKKKKRLSSKDRFLINKYRYFITFAIRKLANRESPFFSCLNEENAFNRQRMSKPCDELIIDPPTLLKSVLETMKEHNSHNMEPHLFIQAVDDMIDRSSYCGDSPFAEFFIERKKITKTVMYVITFNVERL